MAQPVKIGPEFSVNIPAAGTQNAPWVTYLKNGNYVVVWADAAVNAGDIRMQMFAAAGTKLGAEVTVNTNTSNSQTLPRVTALDNGNFVVGWTDPNQLWGNTAPAFVGQLFQGDGTAVGANFLMSATSTTATASSGNVASLPDGGFAAVSATQTTIFLRTFNATGGSTSASLTPSLTFPPAMQGTLSVPTISRLANGNFVIAWEGSTSDGNGTGIRATIVSPTGSVVTGSGIQVNSITTGNQTAPSVTALTSGGFVVVWTDASGSDDIGLGVKVRLFGANGVAVAADLRVNTTTANFQSGAQVRALADGGFVVTWIDASAQLGDPNTITVGQRFDSTGTRVGGEVIIGPVGPSAQSNAVLAINDTDILVVIADSLSDGGNAGVIAQRLAVDLPINDVDTTTEAASKAIAILANDGGLAGIDQLAGATAVVGAAVALPSGATVTLNADGTVSYNPGSAFAYLLASGTTTGGQTTATDTFTYSASGGGVATVTVTITGVTSAGDQIRGTSGPNTLLGTLAADYFDISQGGTDSVSANDGDDLILAGAGYDPTDSIDGGLGYDQVGLRGNYSATLGNVTNTEYLVVLSGTSTRFGGDGTPRYTYNLTTTDATVAAGVAYVVQANELVAGENLTFNGAAETNGSFRIYAGKGTDVLTGGAGDDGFFFGEGGRLTPADQVNGGAGNDQIALRGNYNLIFDATTIVNVETIVLLSANDAQAGVRESATYTYALTLNDATIANGQMLTINGAQLRSGESVAVSAASETNGTVTLIGGAGVDFLTGGSGTDILYGGGGADTLEGGNGNDIFRYGAASESTVAAPDTITDFKVGDIVDLRLIDAVPGGADNAFVFIDAGAFTNVQGQLRVTLVSAGSYLVEGDIDGVGGADFAINVRSDHALTAADFIL